MNLVKNKTLHPHLRDEEALVVENAIRLAIDSIINVLYGVNSSRNHEYQRLVADRDKEIQRLEDRLTEIEHELQVLRLQGCPCGLFGKDNSLVGSQRSGEPQTGQPSGFEPCCVDTEMPAEQRDCEMSISFGLFARPPSHVSSQSHESALPSSPSRMALETSTSHSLESSGASEAARNLPTSPSSLVIKEEPCDIDTVLIKWEMSEERIGEHQESTSSPCQEKESPSVKKKLENRGRRMFKEKPHADPDEQCDPHEEHPRNKKKGVPMSELSDEAQRLKRAAWRAASRRYYARKIARQQANPTRSGHFPFPSRSGPFPPHSDTGYSQPISFVDKKRTLVSELPEESQSLQSEAWRAASRRYYAQKSAEPRTESTQYAHLLQNIEPSGETLGPSTGGSNTNSGEIMCS
ncbi:uncharacterized protein LOC116691638 [Etheostoma spectabile]|uniref:Uncharacterized protein n=1 Tax=Etheostoma spectabile TaxID=54343 RepID=A0A5J5DEU6_9PERO|nr:uncharacterized protein LOC116691638 [Etheostoma spectabile]XP_032375321.1 uncharacterized protein LOC116691638 [Etheostoma spectabile]KAA8591830.1 hypothetical protein FQN60_017204 [Etheostoma spectabile]